MVNREGQGRPVARRPSCRADGIILLKGLVSYSRIILVIGREDGVNGELAACDNAIIQAVGRKSMSINLVYPSTRPSVHRTRVID